MTKPTIEISEKLHKSRLANTVPNDICAYQEYLNGSRKTMPASVAGMRQIRPAIPSPPHPGLDPGSRKQER